MSVACLHVVSPILTPFDPALRCTVQCASPAPTDLQGTCQTLSPADKPLLSLRELVLSEGLAIIVRCAAGREMPVRWAVLSGRAQALGRILSAENRSGRSGAEFTRVVPGLCGYRCVQPIVGWRRSPCENPAASCWPADESDEAGRGRRSPACGTDRSARAVRPRTLFCSKSKITLSSIDSNNELIDGRVRTACFSIISRSNSKTQFP